MFDTLFEISWEVCNKIGGIHTVISSKFSQAKKNVQNYYCIGNYLHHQKEKFEEKELNGILLEVSKKLEKKGIKIHYGKWSVNEISVDCILIDYSNFTQNTHKVKEQLWEHYKIDSLQSDWYDFDETTIWSWAAGTFVSEYSKEYKKEVLLHVHEWMAGGALFYNKINKNNLVKTIFTTHATMLGRAISGNNLNLYDIKDNIDPKKYSYDIGVHTKQQTESALANTADCFTTVSDITGEEAEKFYLKKPDILLYNGFNTKQLHYDYNRQREKINEFLKGYFHLNYPIDVDNTEVIFTSGRNEVRNKGVDILISSLVKLNQKLKEEKSNRTVVCFILLAVGEFDEDPIVRNSFDSYKNNGGPARRTHAPLATHQIPTDNMMLKQLFEQGLLNKEDDRVKVIINPRYLNGADGFFNEDYYEVIAGCDLSVFASFYEPWGYTPLESINLGVPTITSDLAGFGIYLKDKGFKNCFMYEGRKTCSVDVLKRAKTTDAEAADELTNMLIDFTNKNAEELYFNRLVSKELSKQFDWEEFYKNYIKAYEIALGKDL